ncbi:MAG: methyltransferase domain-containing protein [Pseudomonadota bacterium]
MTDKFAEYRRGNKAAWDASAPSHGTGAEWERLLADAAKPGFSELDETLTATLQGLDLSGKTAVQICCNNARELLSLASLGIEPKLGIDQSAAFLAQGAQLSAASGLSPRLLAADIYELPGDLGTFDLALITIGAINWMPDLPGFLRIVASLLSPGGRLVIYETHPFLEMFDPDADDPHALAFSYFDKSAIEVPELIVYDGSPNVASGQTGYWFVHTLGEIVTASINAGLTVERLEEHPHSNREPDYDKYQGREAQLPMCYTLVARR